MVPLGPPFPTTEPVILCHPLSLLVSILYKVFVLSKSLPTPVLSLIHSRHKPKSFPLDLLFAQVHPLFPSEPLLRHPTPVKVKSRGNCRGDEVGGVSTVVRRPKSAT